MSEENKEKGQDTQKQETSLSEQELEKFTGGTFYTQQKRSDGSGGGNVGDFPPPPPPPPPPPTTK
jgi:hypothetical protein